LAAGLGPAVGRRVQARRRVRMACYAMSA